MQRVSATIGAFVIPAILLGARSENRNPGSPGDEPVCVYVSVRGSDSGSGNPDHPLATLAGAQARLRSMKPAGSVSVRIALDTFYNQVVSWSYYNPGHTVTITSWPDTGKAWFIMEKGESSSEPFFRLSAAAGDSTRLILHGFAARGYNAGAIWFTGDDDDETRWNGGNIIEDCLFDSIGNYDMPSAQICYGILDLVNSRGNTIRRCRLADSDNSPWSLQPDGGTFYLPILGVYLAHGSSGNRIYGNAFWNIKGDGVRLRDRCNENSIHHNVFEKTGYYGTVSMWYCDPAYDTCRDAECPSYRNLFFENTLTGNAYCGKAIPFCDMRLGLASGCLDEGTRLSAYSNSLDTCRYHAALRDTGGIE